MFQVVMNQDGEHYHQQRGLYHLCHEEEQQPKNYRANDGGQNLPRRKQPVNLCCCRGTRSVSLTRKGKRRPKKLPAMMWLKLPPSSWPRHVSRGLHWARNLKTRRTWRRKRKWQWLKTLRTTLIFVNGWCRGLRRRIVMLLWIIEVSYAHQE